MDLLRTYAETKALLDTLDLGTLYPGFHPYPFALYTEREVCRGGEVRPNGGGLVGNTAVFLHGEPTAIWDVELDPPADAERFAAGIVHEMFHCHQFACGESRFPSDLTMLAHPGTAESFVLRHRENTCLAQAFLTGDGEQLRRFAALRAQGYRADPAAAEQLQRVETIEGMAEYIELCALRRLSPEKYRQDAARYAEVLCTADERLFDTRRTAYHSGALFCLCLEMLGRPVKNDMADGRTLYAQNAEDPADETPADTADPATDPVTDPSTDPVTDPVGDADIVRRHDALFREREAQIERFVSAARYVPGQARICGYDPMALFRVGDRLYSGHYLRLSEDGRETDITGPAVLVMAPGSADRVIGRYTVG